MSAFFYAEQLFYGIIFAIFLVIAFLYGSKHNANTANKKKFLEKKVQQEKRSFYGEKYRCGYCSMFGKQTDCPRDEQVFNAEPCEVFESTIKNSVASN